MPGRANQIRAFLGKLDTFDQQLNQQRDDITHAIDSTNRLLSYVGNRNDVLDRVLTDIPPLIKHFADTKNLLINAVRIGGPAVSRPPISTCQRRAARCTPTCSCCSVR